MTITDQNRRRFLRGLGGAAVAAPFLPSVAERAAKAAGMAIPASPKRLIVMFTHYGCLTNRWFPTKSHGPLTKDDYLGLQTLKPLAPYADKLLMVRGIRAMNEWSFEGTLGQKNDPMTQVCGSYFTCHPLTPNAATATATNSGKFDGKPTGRSLDHVCAEQVNPMGGPPLFMQLGGISGNTNNTQSVISYDQPQQIFPGFGSPMNVYNSLTGMGGSGASSADLYRAACGNSIIDIVRDDLQSLQRLDMSKSDKKKLSDWVDLLHQTTGTVFNQCVPDTAAKLGLTSDVLQMPGSGLMADLSKLAPVMMDLAVLAAMCDTNRVIFLKYPPNYVFKFLGLTLESASLSGRVGSAAMGGVCVKDAFSMIAAIDSWYAQQFAYLVGRLDGVTEGDKTLLDNTATVWFQQFSDGDAKNLNNLPILQAGGCGGYFKTGWAVNVEGGKTDLTVGHSEDECQGTPPMTAKDLDSVGTPPDQANMPINKYYCNLMNAIGVKAGADGFPAKGGTQPVTCYGKYDDTTLFGTDAPPKISNPGEYTELRANS